MRPPTLPETKNSLIKSKSTQAINDAVLSAQQRAIAVRQKASFGNSSSGYEFGGWKSLFDSIKSLEPKVKNLSAADPVEPDFNSSKAAKKVKKTAETTLCPSSQPDSDEAIAFGVVGGTVESPAVSYLKQTQPVAEIAPASSLVKSTEMLRIASSCQEKGCLHFDGSDCRLAARIVEQLPTVTQTLPACQIRSSCRWWQQEGKSACLRCPQVVTENHYSSPLLEQVSAPQASPIE